MIHLLANNKTYVNCLMSHTLLSLHVTILQLPISVHQFIDNHYITLINII